MLEAKQRSLADLVGAARLYVPDFSAEADDPLVNVEVHITCDDSQQEAAGHFV